MKCPNCGFINPETALSCDCGYDFATGTMRESYLQSKVPPLTFLDEQFVPQLLDLLPDQLGDVSCVHVRDQSGEFPAYQVEIMLETIQGVNNG